MPIQTLTLNLDAITAEDYLTWCRDPDPPALQLTLRSISIDADPLADTLTATLDWNQPVPSPRAAAAMAGLSIPPGIQVHASPSDEPRTRTRELERHPRKARARAGFHQLGGAFALVHLGTHTAKTTPPRQ
jgi:hypothetical protein